jgi:hypothetical protein
MLRISGRYGKHSSHTVSMCAFTSRLLFVRSLRVHVLHACYGDHQLSMALTLCVGGVIGSDAGSVVGGTLRNHNHTTRCANRHCLTSSLHTKHLAALARLSTCNMLHRTLSALRELTQKASGSPMRTNIGLEVASKLARAIPLLLAVPKTISGGLPFRYALFSCLLHV